MSAEAESRRRIRLDLGYRGTDFHGWARQPEARTVQGLIEAGLETVCGTPPTLLATIGMPRRSASPIAMP